ncbi:hypothetical protein [Sorangium sp. So ce131]|uniref:hypothetical protein n=1 Tax=Sorangium sp. So ce131 TaxID=3133282 RepID=UPI003F5D9A2F
MSPDAPVPLALPFGAIGLVGGWLTADQIGRPEPALRLLLTSITPIVAALLGSYLTRQIGGVGPGARAENAGWAEGTTPVEGPGQWTRRGPIVAGLLALGAIGVAGVANGMAIGVMFGPPGLVFGAAFGAVCSLPFMPALAVVLLAASRVGRARAGSIVAASDRRAVWGATAGVIAAAVLAARAWIGAHVVAELGHAVAGVALAVVGALVVADAVALARVVKLPRGRTEVGESGDGVEMGEGGEAGDDDARGAESAACAGALGASGAAGSAERVDLGLGDDVHVEVVRPTHAYRGVRQIARVVRGNRERAAAALRGALVRGGTVLAVGAALWGAPWR